MAAIVPLTCVMALPLVTLGSAFESSCPFVLFNVLATVAFKPVCAEIVPPVSSRLPDDRLARPFVTILPPTLMNNPVPWAAPMVSAPLPYNRARVTWIASSQGRATEARKHGSTEARFSQIHVGPQAKSGLHSRFSNIIV
jgi:hypothetical protein